MMSDMTQNPGREPGDHPSPDGEAPRSKPERPRSPTLRFLSPGPDTSTTQLKVYLGVWAVLLVLWIGAQFWTSDLSGLRRVLYAVLALVALTQMSAAATQLRKRR